MPFTNELTDAQLERLAILSEELGEVQQIIGKILRHGYESRNLEMDNSLRNRALLEIEIGDVLYALALLSGINDIDINNCQQRAQIKAEKIKKYLHFQEE